VRLEPRPSLEGEAPWKEGQVYDAIRPKKKRVPFTRRLWDGYIETYHFSRKTRGVRQGTGKQDYILSHNVTFATNPKRTGRKVLLHRSFIGLGKIL
jgi:hypothetical protein